MIEPRSISIAGLALGIALTLLAVPSSSLAWNPDLPATRFGLAPGAQLRVFGDYGRLSLLVEGEARLDPDSVLYNSVMAGIYAQPVDFLKIGAFYKRQMGARHNEDWVWSDPVSWVWQNVNARAEGLLVLDVTPRWLMPFLPGGSWVGEAKLRYLYNYYNSDTTLLVRPGLTYFWMREGRPLLHVSLQYEADLALNYGRTVFAEHWAYLGLLKPFSERFQLGVQGAYHLWNWSSTAYYAANTSPSTQFVVAQSSVSVGLIAVVHLGDPGQ